MITLEQKKQLQFDARIPHLPTDLTYECRIAIAGEGERGWEWQDKPHRLVYDLCRQVEADAHHIKELVNERDHYAYKLMEANNTYTEMYIEIERLSDKLAKAVGSIKQAIKLWEGPTYGDREYKLDNAYDGFELLCTTLAELEKS